MNADRLAWRVLLGKSPSTWPESPWSLLGKQNRSPDQKSPSGNINGRECAGDQLPIVLTDTHREDSERGAEHLVDVHLDNASYRSLLTIFPGARLHLPGRWERQPICTRQSPSHRLVG